MVKNCLVLVVLGCIAVVLTTSFQGHAHHHLTPLIQHVKASSEKSEEGEVTLNLRKQQQQQQQEQEQEEHDHSGTTSEGKLEEVEETEGQQQVQERPVDNSACWKDAVGRGAGKFPDSEGKCPKGQSKSAGLCYPQCEDGMEGLGPVCWHKCQKPYDYNGLVFCCRSDDVCAAKLKDLGFALPEAIAKMIIDASMGVPIPKIIKDLRKVLEDVSDLRFPLCEDAPDSSPAAETFISTY